MTDTETFRKTIQLRLLGGFSIDAGVPMSSPAGALKLVTLLALRGPTQRNLVAGILWPETTQERAQGCLRSAVWRLRKEFPDLLASQRGTLALADHVSSDVTELAHTAESILRSESLVPENISVLLRDDELNPAWTEEWIVLERERLRLLRLEALDAVADRLLVDRPGAALQAALSALRSDPLRESSCRRAVQALLAQGNVAQARKRYDAYVALLEAELGAAPSPMLSELFADRFPENRRPKEMAAARRCLAHAPHFTRRSSMAPLAAQKVGSRQW